MVHDSMRLVGLPPIVDSRTRVLIVGSFPSEQSLAARQYYANPRNHFWKFIGGLFGMPTTASYVDRTACLLRHSVGLWDVIESCARRGSMDSAIRSPRLNDFTSVIQKCKSLRVVAFNGQKAEECCEELDIPMRVLLPSSSGAYPKTIEWKLAVWKERLAPFLDGRGDLK